MNVDEPNPEREGQDAYLRDMDANAVEHGQVIALGDAFRCRACFRIEEECSAAPCEAVLKDRGAER
jgi:hypothetical protein